MADYFSKFPTITYTPAMGHDPVVIRDITRRVRFIDGINSDTHTFLPYTVEDGMTAEEVAHYYYGDARYVWLVHLANQAKDPYYEWPLDGNLLDKVLAKEYKELAQKHWNDNGQVGDKPVGYGIVHWTQRTDITENIVHYVKNDDATQTINQETYAILSDPTTSYIDPTFDNTEWTAVRIYEHRVAENEARRNIFLVNSDYRDRVEQELERLINND